MVMNVSLGEQDGVRGVQQAIERYGLPGVRSYVYQVTQETCRYWEMVRRKRDAEVVMLLRRHSGRYIVHTKAFYPKGVYRLLTGGIKPGEDLVAALEREMAEETGLDTSVERFLGILDYRFVHQKRSIAFRSYLFALVERGSNVLASNDPKEAISGYREIPLAELSDLASDLEALSPDWLDWGRFRAAAHRFIVEALTSPDE